MMSRTTIYLGMIFLFAILVFACKPKKQWILLEISYGNVNTHEGSYHFKLEASGNGQWQPQNWDTTMRGKIKFKKATPELMHFLDDALTKEEFTKVKNYYSNCDECGVHWFFVKYNDDSEKITMFMGFKKGSNPLIDELESFMAEPAWKDSLDIQLRLEMGEKALKHLNETFKP